MSEPTEEERSFNAALERFWKAGIGGVLVTLPVLLGVAIGLPTIAVTLYLCGAIVVLTVIVLRRRR